MTPAQEQIIQAISARVEKEMSGDGSGHDWWHAYRVWKLAIRIGQAEGADFYVTSLAALLHDLDDWKINDSGRTDRPEKARAFMNEAGVGEATVDLVCDIVSRVSFKGGGVKDEMKTLEGQCVQDADRLEAIGAIGIARVFAYGGSKGMPLYDPNIEPETHDSFEKYSSSKGTCINHFYEKLLLLKDRMNTNTARNMAEARHLYMEDYLDRFYREWDGRE